MTREELHKIYESMKDEMEIRASEGQRVRETTNKTVLVCGGTACESSDSPKIYEKVIGNFVDKTNIYPFKVNYNDSWARDNCPIFVTSENKLRAVDFRFNAWGGEVDGLYSDYKYDDKL